MDLFPVTEGTRLIGCISTREIKGLSADDWDRHTVAEMMVACSEENTIDADADAVRALSVMNRTGHHRLLVRDGDRLVGVLTHKDMLNYLSLRFELENAE